MLLKKAALLYRLTSENFNWRVQVLVNYWISYFTENKETNKWKNKKKS